MDGVLADFDLQYEIHFGVRPSKQADDVDWVAVRRVKDFYLTIPPMADMHILWEYLRPHKPAILTGIPKSVEEAPDNKRSWVRRNLGADVRVHCCPSKEKFMYARPGDVLIDDWEKYKLLWTNVGGLWITHKSALDTINALQTMGVW